MDDELDKIPDDFLVLWWKRELAAILYSDSYAEHGSEHERTLELRAQYKLVNDVAVELYNNYALRVGRQQVNDWWDTVRKLVRGPSGIRFWTVRMTNGR